MGIKSKILGSALFIGLATSCTGDRLQVDVSDQQVDIHYLNIDQEVNGKSAQELTSLHHQLTKDLTDLYQYELSFNLRQIGQTLQPQDTAIGEKLHYFYAQEFIAKLEEEKNKAFDLPVLEQEINDGFKHVKYHFPNAPLPTEIIWMNNLFAKVHASDSAVSVGLEFYLGENHELIQNIPTNNLYAWQRRRMVKSYIARDVVQAWLQANVFKVPTGKLIENIIHAGKVIYAVEAAFPNASDEDIMRYSSAELKYAREHEGMFWKYLVDQKLLFDNTERDKANLLNEGPYTVGLPDDSPDRMGQFLGWQMVKSFMDKNEDVSLPQLLEIDYNKILQSYDTK
ncbi:hypothetical protein SAMN05216474_3040 [Lishizhenia tianjinensis]|uniref:Gliding motility-associated lipoprotein GldB n=1 Tax=Lishizhenia tianjinensis TaxID=477690 RepID=A0A1I7BS27_9FLAO|nr:hypothetical protein [Lishizhenia tianjinensis]SFT89966.1 hypothetical protein SAMN05216474_3040 [Lishizhenia tianjinensis]